MILEFTVTVLKSRMWCRHLAMLKMIEEKHIKCRKMGLSYS